MGKTNHLVVVDSYLVETASGFRRLCPELYWKTGRLRWLSRSALARSCTDFQRPSDNSVRQRRYEGRSDQKMHKHTSSCEEKTANPAPVGLCWSGVRSVQKAIGRPPNCVNQLSSSDCVVSCGRPFI